MVNPTTKPSGLTEAEETTRIELANRVFFRLYQCANMLHKTGTKAVEAEGLTTQQWAVLGALARPAVREGMSMGDLARYLKVSRQNLSGLLSRMERDGRIQTAADERDRRSRLVSMTDAGLRVWQDEALPKIHGYYAQVLEGFSVNDIAHTLHYLLKILDNMQAVDDRQGGGDEAVQDA